jgi:hypothetical protein
MPLNNLGYGKEVGDWINPVEFLKLNEAVWPGV